MSDPYTTLIMGDGEGEPVEINLDPTEKLSRVGKWYWSREGHHTIFYADGSSVTIGMIPFKR